MGMQMTTAATAPKRALTSRVLVQMPVQATWKDTNTGQTVLVDGMTENVGTGSVLVNFDNLPPVGGEVHLKVLDEEATLLEVETEVIRVERDPSKPLAALSVLDHVNEWQERVWSTAQEVAARTYASDEDEWVN